MKNFPNKNIHILHGETFGRLRVLDMPPERIRNVWRWWVQCSCGSEPFLTAGANLRSGESQSCGCLRVERCKEINTSHGHTSGGHKTREFVLWYQAKRRAQQENLPFEITVTDLRVPEFCPILGIALSRHNTKFEDNSPSIDKVIPHLGYIKGNVAIISWRANKIKQDASFEELFKIAGWVKAWVNNFTQGKGTACDS